MSPIEVWETFPTRIISRFYSLIWKDRLKFRFYLARLAGSDAREPDWSEMDRPFNKKSEIVETSLDDKHAQIIERDGKTYKRVCPGLRPAEEE